MAPAATVTSTKSRAPPPKSFAKRAWNEERTEIPSILVGRGQENASTARHGLEKDMDSGGKSSEHSRSRGRQSSLRHVKNSTEVLRQRSLKRGNKGVGTDANAVTREGRQFTVANVGNNGKIYLRPTARTPQTANTPSTAYPIEDNNIAYDSDVENLTEKKRWSESQASRTPTNPRRAQSIGHRAGRSNSISGRSSRISRSNSVSTIEAGRYPDNGAYKVVINHGHAGQQKPGETSLHSLDVSIPHYRLGHPRFSTQGTAFLRNTVYSRTSTNDDLDTSAISRSEVDRGFPLPPNGNSQTHIQSQIEAHTQTIRSAPANAPLHVPILSSSPVFHRAREPIVPAIFDAIAANPDDRSIVRYAMSTREISAASPARIIAQITSKSFLDYELLSDFFLTARAYLSTNDLLAYLLARFEWAINKFDDPGKVIQVRTFAAIRHWVLNYFPYDFVMDRDLRVRFCERLNAIAQAVRARTSREPGDLKLIIDLKKCWNGRCALYWDCLQGESDGRNDIDISPGGIIGSRDSQLTHPSELWAKLATTSSHQLDQEKSVAALHNWVDSVIEAELDGTAKGDRKASITASSHPTSPFSDQSVQAMSCSIPGKTLKAYATQSKGRVAPHPIPTAIPPTVRKVGPATSSAKCNERATRLNKEHKRSGSFTDALRDQRNSLGAVQEAQPSEHVILNMPLSGSLVRGSILPPGSPFIDNLARHGSAVSLQKQSPFAEGIDNTRLAARPMSPNVRNLLANIRKAWSSKPSSNPQTPDLLSSAPFMLEAKSTTLPMHIAYKIEGFGDQHHQLEALKKNARIDLLCADVTDMFERAMTHESKNTPEPFGRKSAIGNEPRQATSVSQQLSPERDVLLRNHSGVTTGSRSIVIMDDTSNLEPPVPDIPIEFNQLRARQDSDESSSIPFTMNDASTPPLPAAFEPLIPAKSPKRGVEEGDTPQSELLPEFTIPGFPAPPVTKPDAVASGGVTPRTSTHRPRPSFTTGKSFRSTYSGSKSLRKYASYQSGMRRSGPDPSLDTTTASGSPIDSSSGRPDQPPGRMLRRRPGGDLRANQNVHDMEPVSRPRSTGSITTYTESAHNSTVYLKRTAHNTSGFKPQHATQQAAPGLLPASKKPPSPVRPPSKEHKKDLRPSFEMAVAEFARIPDDEGGDLEATLLKLEGKFRKSPVGSSEGPTPSRGRIEIDGAVHTEATPRSPKRQLQPNEAGSKDGLAPPVPANASKSDGSQRTTAAKSDDRTTMTRSLYAESEESYDSVPVLERGLQNGTSNRGQTASDQSNVAVPPPLFIPAQTPTDELSNPMDSASESAPGIGVRRGRYRSSVPTATTDSFLLDEDEFLSDLSSDLSDDIESNTALDQAFDSAVRHEESRQLPPNVGYASGYLPSPPMTKENVMAITSETNRIQEERKPPTPEPSPVSRLTESSKSRTPNEVDGSVLQPFANTVHQFPTRRHIPFVLAFDAAILAQQFTLIERDALNEINWQDLIDMRWSNVAPSALNWVEYLRFQDPNGIDLVTARFNLVVKWAQSEIVLTQNVEERALAIMKFIHIAQHARKLRNYATLLQLTIALTSIDVARLTKTVALVPDAERAWLKTMEVMVSPVRNFHNLRGEIEVADVDEGCIPVVALSIHDLTYNAQKPSVIASTRDAEPLINFERYRRTAMIVKSLLRLIDASAKYDFKPVEGALERCLWMASLSDEGIRTKSRALEV